MYTISFFCMLFSCLVDYLEVIVNRFSSHMGVLCVTKHTKTLQELVITLTRASLFDLTSIFLIPIDGKYVLF